MVMISSLLPVGQKLKLSMRGDKPDNFEFKGLPGQFNEQGEKVLDEFGDPIKEETLNEDSYHSGAIDDFIKKNDDGDEYNIPRIKVFGGKGDTKFLNVSYDALRQISKILKKMKI
jgi:hypothetical protein